MITAAVSLAALSCPGAVVVVAAAVLMGGGWGGGVWWMVESETEIAFQIFAFTPGKIQRMA